MWEMILWIKKNDCGASDFIVFLCTITILDNGKSSQDRARYKRPDESLFVVEVNEIIVF